MLSAIIHYTFNYPTPVVARAVALTVFSVYTANHTFLWIDRRHDEIIAAEHNDVPHHPNPRNVVPHHPNPRIPHHPNPRNNNTNTNSRYFEVD